MAKVKVAATQMACSDNRTENINKAEALVRQAAEQGAQIILLQELFETPYFCLKEKPEYLFLSTTLEDNPAVNHFKPIAKELKVVLPISFFELRDNARFNSVAVIDANGEVLGVYRKTHIPDGPGGEEKYYFNPGDTGFRVWQTKYAAIGIGICWDQWFPEAARCMAVMGAELLFYPSAIGPTPLLEAVDPGFDLKGHWQRVMQGHAAANIVPLIACNRVGREEIDDIGIPFFGSSFIADEVGEKIAEADQTSETIVMAEFDLGLIRIYRQSYGFYRDRRPEMYAPLLKLHGGE